MKVLLAFVALALAGAAFAQKTTYLSFGAEYDFGQNLTILASLDTPAVDIPSLGHVGPIIQLRASTDFKEFTATAYLGVQLQVNPSGAPWLIQFQLIEKPAWTVGSDPTFTTAVGVQYVTAVPALSW